MFESEERRIVRRIKDFVKSKNSPDTRYIMLRNGRILDIDDYFDMVKAGKLTPHDAYVYIDIGIAQYKATFYYPFLDWYVDLFYAYLSKLGFHYLYFAAPATGLKYVAAAVRYENYLAIEVVNLYTAVNNTNLPKIVSEVLYGRLISGEKVLIKDEDEKIYGMFKSQRLFAGHDFDGAWNIIYEYYDKGNQSLAKEVFRIGIDYIKIFNPYRVCYDMNNWKEINCLSIKLD